MNMIAGRALTQDFNFPGTVSIHRQAVVAIVSDDGAVFENLGPVCEFLGLRVERISPEDDLAQVLRDMNPMAVIAAVDGGEQDGFHTMKLVARISRDLPILLLTDGDPALMGAADAVQDLWGLTSVTRTTDVPLAGQMVSFLFTAGRRAGCMRLVPV